MDGKKIKLVITRNFREAWQNFLRSGFLTVGSIAVLALALYIATLSFTLVKGVAGALQAVEEKVTMSVYFKVGTEEQIISEAQKAIGAYPEVKSIEYVSADQALEIFRAEYANEPSTLESLNEIGDTNPLPASLVISAKENSQYEAILNKLKGESFASEVERNNYEKRKETIDKLYAWLKTLSRIGWTAGALFALVAVLIVFNSVQITIFSQSSEIEVMKLVGAPHSFIRLPFVLEGIMYGITGAILSFVGFVVSILIINSFLSSGFSQNFMALGGLSFWAVLSLNLLLGALLGVLSALFAVARYLKA